jgi:hypothetical protein
MCCITPFQQSNKPLGWTGQQLTLCYATPNSLPATQGQRPKNQKNAHTIGMGYQTKTSYLRWRSTRSISCSTDAATAAT